MKRLITLLLTGLLTFQGAWALASAAEPQGDFLFFEGLTWDTTVDEVDSCFGVKETSDDEVFGSIRERVYDKVAIKAMDTTATVVLDYDEVTRQVYLCLLTISVKRPLFSIGEDMSMSDAYNQVAEMCDQTYGADNLVCDSMDVIRDRTELDPDTQRMRYTFLASLDSTLNFLENGSGTVLADMITGISGWLRDDRYGAAVFYSGQKKNDNALFVLLSDVTFSFAALDIIGDQPDDPLWEARLGLPQGVAFGDSLEAFIEAAGVPLTQDDYSATYLYSAETSSTGYITLMVPMFGDGGFVGVYYYLSTTDYDALYDIMQEDYGVPATVSQGLDMSAFIAQMQDVGTQRAEAWLFGMTEVVLCDSPLTQQTCVIIMDLSSVM